MPELRLRVSEDQFVALERLGELRYGRVVKAVDVARLEIARLVQPSEIEKLSLRKGTQTEPQRRCLLCGEALAGKQQKWCGDSHRSLAYQRRRADRS